MAEFTLGTLGNSDIVVKQVSNIESEMLILYRKVYKSTFMSCSRSLATMNNGRDNAQLATTPKWVVLFCLHINLTLLGGVLFCSFNI